LDLYQHLYASSFISTYASTNPWDDFADSLAYYFSAENLKATYILDTAQGTSYDVVAKLFFASI
jgi:hypothetical protein